MKKTVWFVLMVLLLTAMVWAEGKTEDSSEEKSMTSISLCTPSLYQKMEKEDLFVTLFKEETGIDLEISHLPSGDWTKMIMPLYTAGTNADLSQMPNQVTPFINQGFLEPLDSFIDADPKWKKLKEDAPGIFDSGQFQGKTYALATKKDQSMICWVRKDWLDQLDLPIPSNWNELNEMLEAFSTLPQVNGKDVIPLVMTSHVWNHDVFASAFGVFNRVVKVGDRGFKDYFLTTQYRDYLDYMKNLYDMDILDKETPTNRNKTVRQKFMEGYTGALVMWESNYETLVSGLASNGFDQAEVVAIPPFKGPEGIFGLSSTEAPPRMAISSNSDNPQFVFDTLLDWIYFDQEGIISTTTGVEGYEYTVVNGVYTPIENRPMLSINMSFPPANPDFKFPFELTGASLERYEILETVSGWVRENQKDVFKNFMPKDAVDYWSIDADLYDRKRSLFSRYIMGDIDYEGFVKEYTSYTTEIGLEQMLAEVNG